MLVRQPWRGRTRAGDSCRKAGGFRSAVSGLVFWSTAETPATPSPHSVTPPLQYSRGPPIHNPPVANTFASLSPGDIPVGRLYDLLVCTVQPRPIAFVSTISSDGHVNLAPYSFFTAGGANPPSLVYCPSLTREGKPKDSLRNAEETGEFVVNMVVRPMAASMNLTGVDYPHDVDEFAIAGLTPIPSLSVSPPRVLESPVQYECKVVQVIRLGAGPSGTVYVIGEVVRLHIDSELWRDGEFDPSSFRAIGRMGGKEYVDLAEPEIFEMVRPKLH